MTVGGLLAVVGLVAWIGLGAWLRWRAQPLGYDVGAEEEWYLWRGITGLFNILGLFIILCRVLDGRLF